MELLIPVAESLVELIALLIGILITAGFGWVIANSKTFIQAWRESRFSRYLHVVETLVFWQLSAMRRSGELEKLIDYVDELKDQLFIRVENILDARGLPIDLDVINLAIEKAIENVLMDYFDYEVDLGEDTSEKINE